MNAGAFLIQVRQELKKVTWPTRAEVVQMTTLVIIVSLAVGIYIGVIDVALTKAIETVVK
ncbi:preprotein translocase subunit SecE [Candidatus Roizmanbacteria bacterium RIFCSPLOWO2_01_FULL_45_11]|uniref:Protein translocase subunit SecE n=1 Tax=Candidatus Roizmanbacteria bacterium RIFCSPLOWO2_01_FULL_45_11 TaxID=1802070 RepID=A0A1F7JDR5_9BACT|nr:MAG: preprotein translocase subunit SecE [Candidatus Roizmanbacteria bacterium RIFCSPLOWO2_01_FULL_45_11]